SGLVRNRQRTPAQLSRSGVGVVERRAANPAVVGADIGTMHDRRLNAISPGPAIVMPRGGERSSRYQFGVKSVRRTLRRIAPHRQGSWNRLAGKMIAEPGLIDQFAAPRARGSLQSGLLLNVVHSRSGEGSLFEISHLVGPLGPIASARRHAWVCWNPGRRSLVAIVTKHPSHASKLMLGGREFRLLLECCN